MEACKLRRLQEILAESRLRCYIFNMKDLAEKIGTSCSWMFVLVSLANASVVEARDEQNLNSDLERVAKGFLLIQHGGETMTVEGSWAGTIFAPNADLVLGQSSKKLYGRFLGRDVTVLQYATVHHVAFEPETATEIAGRGR